MMMVPCAPPGRGWLGRAIVVALVAGAAICASSAAASVLVYAPAPAADAIHATGLPSALRQAPIVEAADPRWTPDRRLGKVSGSELAARDASGMVALLRQRWQQDRTGEPVGGRVAVDELLPSQWSTAASRQLAQAMAMLGDDARRVHFYLSPAFVERVGRADPREALPTAPDDIRTLSAAIRPGIVYLELYRGDLQPFPRDVMAQVMTRWEQRWPEARRADLRLLFGPGGSVSQEEIWNRVRSTPAGRRLVSNRPGYYATLARGTAADGAAWARQVARHRAAPDAPPPGGDVVVPGGGGVTLPIPAAPIRPGVPLTIRADRTGVAAVRLISPTGTTRILRARPLAGDPTALRFTMPRDLRPGLYRVAVEFLGSGLRDRIQVSVQVGPASAAVPVRTEPSGALEQLRRSQGSSVDAVRLLNAIDAWLDAGIVAGDLRPGSFGAGFAASGAMGPLGPGLAWTRTDAPSPPAAFGPRPITPARARASGGRVRVTPAQLLINQRISSAAVARANAIDARLSGGLTGGDLRPGALAPWVLTPGVGIAVSADGPVPAASKVVPKPIRRGSARGLRVTRGQLLINRRIADAALRRARALAQRLEAGLGEGDFRAGSIVRANLSPELGGAPVP